MGGGGGALVYWWSMIFSENRRPPSGQARGQAFRDHALGACSDEVDAPFAVVAGLDPAIHPFAKMMDPRVKPAGDV